MSDKDNIYLGRVVEDHGDGTVTVNGPLANFIKAFGAEQVSEAIKAGKDATTITATKEDIPSWPHEK